MLGRESVWLLTSACEEPGILFTVGNMLFPIVKGNQSVSFSIGKIFQQEKELLLKLSRLGLRPGQVANCPLREE